MFILVLLFCTPILFLIPPFFSSKGYKIPNLKLHWEHWSFCVYFGKGKCHKFLSWLEIGHQTWNQGQKCPQTKKGQSKKAQYIITVIFSSTGGKPAELMSWRGFRCPLVFFLFGWIFVKLTHFVHLINTFNPIDFQKNLTISMGKLPF